jgi:DNA invertase Pin-like site-specific DNA recombinase
VSKRKPSNARNITNSYYLKTISEGRFPRFELSVQEEIKEMLADGVPLQVIADELGVDVTQVYKVKRRLKNSG